MVKTFRIMLTAKALDAVTNALNEASLQRWTTPDGIAAAKYASRVLDSIHRQQARQEHLHNRRYLNRAIAKMRKLPTETKQLSAADRKALREGAMGILKS